MYNNQKQHDEHFFFAVRTKLLWARREFVKDSLRFSEF